MFSVLSDFLSFSDLCNVYVPRTPVTCNDIFEFAKKMKGGGNFFTTKIKFQYNMIFARFVTSTEQNKMAYVPQTPVTSQGQEEIGRGDASAILLQENEFREESGVGGECCNTQCNF